MSKIQIVSDVLVGDNFALSNIKSHKFFTIYMYSNNILGLWVYTKGKRKPYWGIHIH